jgi:hypothetical protein
MGLFSPKYPTSDTPAATTTAETPKPSRHERAEAKAQAGRDASDARVHAAFEAIGYYDADKN